MSIKKKAIKKQGCLFRIDNQPATGEDEFKSIERIREGYSWKVVEELQEACHLKDTRLAKVIGVSVSTLTRLKSKKSKLEPRVSDRFYRFRKIVHLAANVFEDADQGLKWLRRPQPGLKGLVPIDMLDTDPGAEAVERLLHQIDLGVLP